MGEDCCTVFSANTAPVCRQDTNSSMTSFWRALKRADIPATKEPAGVSREGGKRPDGLALVPLQGGRCLTWDATIVDTLAVSSAQNGATVKAGAANAAAARKHAKHDAISSAHLRTCSG